MEISLDQSVSARCGLAVDPSTPPDILAILAQDVDWLVRWKIAMNPSTPSDALASLSQDDDYIVRWRIAKNPSTPSDVWVLGHGRVLP